MSTTRIKSCIYIKKFPQENSHLQACVCFFSLSSPNDRTFTEKVCIESVPKDRPKGLSNFCIKPKTTNART